jgi:hypothetical protein
MNALEVASSFAVLRVLPRAMLNMILRPVIYLLLMDLNGAIAMHASNVRRSSAEELRNGRYRPLRNRFAINKEVFFLLTLCH